MGNWDDELVDVLYPGSFTKTGIQKSIKQAHRDGDWLGSFNLWVLRRESVPSILYQQRSIASSLWPKLLDVTVGGHYMAGESIQDGLREVKEEIGKDYEFDRLIYLGKKLFVGDKPTGEKLRYCVDVFFVEDNDPLSTYQLQREEVEGLFICPIDKLIKIHLGEIQMFDAYGIRYDDERLISDRIEVSKDIFPHNWDNYHFKITILANKYFFGEQLLLY